MTSAFPMNAEGASAIEILAIPENEPERLFLRNLDQSKKIRNALLKKWHPDHNPDAQASAVMQHITKLFKAAEDKLDKGIWSTPGVLALEAENGRKFELKYIKRHDFELGEYYISNTKITYVVRASYKDLFDNAIKRIQELPYANDKMKDGFSSYMPQIHQILTAKSGDRVLVVEKHPDAVSLRDCFNHVSGAMDPKHAAWIMSRLHNFTSYLQWAGLTHNGISLDSCFIIGKDTLYKRNAGEDIAPKDHCLSVMGGWWYAAKAGDNLLGLPAHVVNYVPRAALASGKADPQIDRTLIRIAGREMLGDITGVRLARDKTMPKAMVDWLAVPGSGDALKDFKTWREKILTDSFGPKKFVEMNIGPNDVYALKS